MRIFYGSSTKALIVEGPDLELDRLLEKNGIIPDRRKEVPDEVMLIRWLQEGKHGLLFKRSRVPVTRAVLEACPDLAAIQLCCIGDDSVDKQACADHGVLVFNDPVSNARSVVELAISHLIALSRRLYETNEDTKKGGFDKSSTERYEILGRPIGILGLGNIGRQVARAAEALGMRVLFYDTREVSREVGREMGWEECRSMDTLFRKSEYISVHVSAQDIWGNSNRGLLTAEHFQVFGAERPEDAPRIFLNLARGFVHSPEDLIAALETGRVRRAAVDVYPDEPRGKELWENPYKNHSRIVTTPHLGAATQDAQPRIARRVVQTIRAFNMYGSLRDCVFRPRLSLQINELPPDACVLAVAHRPLVGSRKAIQDAIYEARVSNLASLHQDFEELGIAYDLCAIDRPLTPEQLRRIAAISADLTGDPSTVRSIRQIPLQNVP